MLFNCSVVSNSFTTPWTLAYQAPLSMGFPRQEYQSGLPFPPPGDRTQVSCIAGGFFTTEPPGKANDDHYDSQYCHRARTWDTGLLTVARTTSCHKYPDSRSRVSLQLQCPPSLTLVQPDDRSQLPYSTCGPRTAPLGSSISPAQTLPRNPCPSVPSQEPLCPPTAPPPLQGARLVASILTQTQI